MSAAMPADYFLISGGYVYDPANGIDGQVKDLWIRDGKVVEPPTEPGIKPTRTLNASGLVIMPGGWVTWCLRSTLCQTMAPLTPRPGLASRWVIWPRLFGRFTPSTTFPHR